LKNYGIVIVFGIILTIVAKHSIGQTTVIDQKFHTSTTCPIPLAGNCWVEQTSVDTTEVISNSGLSGWKNPATKLNIYFSCSKGTKLELALRIKVLSGKSSFKYLLNGTSKNITISNPDFTIITLGSFTFKDGGYQKLTIQGLTKTGSTFGEISDVVVSGNLEGIHYVKDDFYWGRRGPSVHLSYAMPPQEEAIWFYNEVTVPKSNDVIGSYFMAAGFAEGYFGIQVNSASERRILFSVWSPFKTDNPNAIPEDQKIKLLKSGPSVYAGNFGDEGSGGQSYLRFNWKAGNTYRFLLHGVPSDNNSTDFTAYFFAPEINKWQLIASFNRPKTTTTLKRIHSFLENFIPENGNLSRSAFYSNPWIHTTKGNWLPITKAKFTADATARKGARIDYIGGKAKDGFYLKNCGFFNSGISIDSWIENSKIGKAPEIDFKALP